MKVTLLGATGFVGKVLSRHLLDAGHELKALVRNPTKLGHLSDEVTCVEGDFFKNEDIDSVIEDADVVMSTIGPSKTEMSSDFAANCVTATRHLVNALQECCPRRLVLMAGAAMPIAGERLNPLRSMMAFAIKTMARSSWEGKVTEMQVAFGTALDVTVVRPPMITKSAHGSFHAHETRLGGISVGVNHVAEFMVNLLATSEWTGKAPVIWTRRTWFG